MNVAMLSWRYLDHPQGGGAEILTHQILRRAVQRGVKVTAFTASYPGAEPTGELDGVRIVRSGQQHTVHLHAWRWLRTRLDEFDRVVDQINTIAFLTPLYVPADKRRMFIHQMAREYWFRETRGLFRLGAPVGYALEPWQLRLYRNTPSMTVSGSTHRDLADLGIPVTAVLPQGTHVHPVERLEPKPGPPRAIVVGRLTPAKFVEQSMAAFGRIQAAIPDIGLDIVGSGDPTYRQELEALVATLGLRDVVFHGHVDESRKRELLLAAHVHLFASHREGWGLTVSEAALVGTPTVAYDVAGVRDSVADLRALAPRGRTDVLAERALRLLRDPSAYDDLRAAAWARARELSWDRSTDAFLEALA